VTSSDAVFRESTAERRVASVPLSHLSIELGHLYLEDFAVGPQHLRRYFQQVAPWVNAARQACAEHLQSQRIQHNQSGQQGRRARARVSTCFLVDDYFTRFSSPAELVPGLVSAAREAGLEIDYLARESGCAHADRVELARLVEGRLVADPPPDTNGSRPPGRRGGMALQRPTVTGERCSRGHGRCPAMDATGPERGASALDLSRRGVVGREQRPEGVVVWISGGSVAVAPARDAPP